MLHNTLKKLEKSLKCKILVIASASRQDIAVDLNELAAKHIRTLCKDGEKYTVVLFGGGGELGFADSVKRTLGNFDAIVGDRISGSLSLLALCADTIQMSKHGAIGAFDSGLFWRPDASIDGFVYDDIPALGGLKTDHDPMMPGRVAQLRNFQRRAKIWLEANGPTFEIDRLKSVNLGLDTGLSETQIGELGFSTNALNASDLLDLLNVLDEKLGNKSVPLLRYSESDLADEVEFEFAAEVPGAIISTSERSFTYALDTGNPNPDTGQFVGGWSDSLV